MKQYIFGYGSLLDRNSRLGTVPGAENVVPVKLKGMVRGWWARTKVVGLSTTYLGCMDANSKLFDQTTTIGWTNGVIFEVSNDDLIMLDDREKNYVRTRINLADLTGYSDRIFQDDFPVDQVSVWIYLNAFDGNDDFYNSQPTKLFPIVQSYVDTCLNGCLDLEIKAPGFLADFIRTTWGWKGAWANDRIFPRRPHVYVKNAYIIDKLLKEHLPEPTVFDHIYIE